MLASSAPFLLWRPEVASGMADALMGLGPFHYGSGLFLAAPRRTGKSTFMREDLVPAPKDRGMLTTYVETHGGMTRANGQRLRDLLLSRGHTQHYTVMFRNMVGHDPEVGPLLVKRGFSAQANPG
jgi:hypothetical protein